QPAIPEVMGGLEVGGSPVGASVGALGAEVGAVAAEALAQFGALLGGEDGVGAFDGVDDIAGGLGVVVGEAARGLVELGAVELLSEGGLDEGVHRLEARGAETADGAAALQPDIAELPHLVGREVEVADEPGQPPPAAPVMAAVPAAAEAAVAPGAEAHPAAAAMEAVVEAVPADGATHRQTDENTEKEVTEEEHGSVSFRFHRAAP